MPSAVEDPPALHDALELLHKASRTSAKQRTVKLSSVVDVICRHAFQRGVDQDALREIVHVISVKTYLDQSAVTTLIKNLYPAGKVPSDIVVTIVGALGQGKGKPSPSSQDSLVKWLITVYDILENPNVLSRLYGVLFGMLDMLSIRTSLCHLLSVVTRRKHVKPFRIQQVLELSRGLGNEPALQGLLRVFKDYYPDIILGTTSTSRKSFAPQPDGEWRTRISLIQEASFLSDNATNNHHNGFKVLRKGHKRSKLSAIPDVHTYHATEASVTLEGIDNVDDFVEKLDRIDPPGQLVSFLNDPLLQKYVDLRPSPMISSRVDLWIGVCLEELYEGTRMGVADRRYLSDVLQGLVRHVEYAKELSPIISRFLEEYLKIWDGQTDTDAILELLTYVPVQNFGETYSIFFQPLEQLLSSQGVVAVEKLLDFYATLLQHQGSGMRSRNTKGNRKALRTFIMLAEHVNMLAMSLLLTTPTADVDEALLSAVLRVYEQLASMPTPYLVPIVLPEMRIAYLLAISTSPAAYGRLCSVIAGYKSAFDDHPKPVREYYPAEVTDSLNWCLRDIYNLIWVARGLHIMDQKALGCHCDPALRSNLDEYVGRIEREYSISNAHNFSNNPCLALLASSAWRSIEDREIQRQGYDSDSITYHQGPVSQRSLEVLKMNGGVSVDYDGAKGFKVLFLHWLAERGMPGVKDLMFATVSDLKGKV